MKHWKVYQEKKIKKTFRKFWISLCIKIKGEGANTVTSIENLSDTFGVKGSSLSFWHYCVIYFLNLNNGSSYF